MRVAETLSITFFALAGVIVRELPEGKIDFDVSDEDVVEVRCGSSFFKIIGLPMRDWSAPQRGGDHRRESTGAGGDRAQALHQAVENAALLVVVAIAHAYAPGMPPGTRTVVAPWPG